MPSQTIWRRCRKMAVRKGDSPPATETLTFKAFLLCGCLHCVPHSCTAIHPWPGAANCLAASSAGSAPFTPRQRRLPAPQWRPPGWGIKGPRQSLQAPAHFSRQLQSSNFPLLSLQYLKDFVDRLGPWNLFLEGPLGMYQRHQPSKLFSILGL